MTAISEVKASNVRISDETAPQTVVMTGATDGIGKATLIRLIATKVPVKVYVIGRNGEKHNAFLDQLRGSNKLAQIIWLEGQLSLLADTRRLCDEIQSREQHIDVLYMSAGFIASGERIETSEGNTIWLSLTYSGRMLMITRLLPLLNASPRSPRIISILATGYESPSIHLDDLDLKQPGRFTLTELIKAGATYTTLSMSRLAKENPRVVFIHHSPGGVDTGVFRKAWGDKWFFPALNLLMRLAATSPMDAAEKIIYMMTSAKYGGIGVPLTAGQSQGLNMAKTTETGSLFLVNDKLKELQQEKIMAKLHNLNGGEIIWQMTVEMIRPYV
ncbi:NAD(P)-binding protein [Penicillium alfredii]|uniref:NAD(P)-binding protein n=1 Tax=Penicillium alfredii TaxID=1506179 RepID=A0A9W9KGB9_9EURO|nr:NAD(P)-binding protein [Penicillium alfredii]KAJ5105420.1 NAD(P)-binding protein [Penicillium alfredii]